MTDRPWLIAAIVILAVGLVVGSNLHAHGGYPSPAQVEAQRAALTDVHEQQLQASMHRAMEIATRQAAEARALALMEQLGIPEAYRPLLVRWCADPAMAARTMHEETGRGEGYNPNAVSYMGARGLMQVMPGTARGVAKSLGLASYDLTDPSDNVRIGCAILDASVRERQAEGLDLTTAKLVAAMDYLAGSSAGQYALHVAGLAHEERVSG